MRTTSRTKFDFELKKKTPQKVLFYFFSPEDLALLTLLRKVKPFLNHKMIKLLTFGNLFPPLHSDILAKTCSRVTTAITFSRQNDAGSRKRTT